MAKKLKPSPLRDGVVEVRVDRGVLIVVIERPVINAENMRADIDFIASAMLRYGVSRVALEVRGVEHRDISLAGLSDIGRYLAMMLTGSFALLTCSYHAAFVIGVANRHARERALNFRAARFDTLDDAWTWLRRGGADTRPPLQCPKCDRGNTGRI